MKTALKSILFIIVLLISLLFIDSSTDLSKVKALDSDVPTNVKIENVSNSSAKITWSEVKGIYGYEIYQKNGDKYNLVKTIDNSKTTSWIHEELTPNTKYTYAIKTISNNGLESEFSHNVSTYLVGENPEYTNIKSVIISNIPTSIEIGKYINATASIVKENENLDLIDNNLTWETSNESIAKVNNSGTITTYKKGTVVIIARGHNGAFASETFEVVNSGFLPVTAAQTQSPKSKSLTAPTKLKAKRISSKKIKLTWNKVEGAQKYEVYRIINKKYKKIATVKGTSYINKKLKKNKQYYYRVKSYKKESGKKYWSNFTYTVSSYTRTKNSKYTNLKKIVFFSNPKKVEAGDKIKISYLKLGDNHYKKIKNKKLVWWSSNNKLASVNSKGVVTTKNPGEVKIWVRAHNGKTFSIKFEIESKYAEKIPILTFHRIVTDKNKKEMYANDQWTASVNDFETQMKYLYDNKYRTISAEEFENWYNGKIELPKKTVMVTFDDGDYEIYYLVLPILKKYNIKATDFIIGSFTNNFTMPLQDEGRYRIGTDLINKIAYEYPNLKFESHTYNLHYRDINMKPIAYSKTYDEFMDDFESNKSMNFKYIAYPFGVATYDFLKAAEDSGMHLGFEFGAKGYRCATRTDNRFSIPRVKINGQITYNQYVKKLKNYLK